MNNEAIPNPAQNHASLAPTGAHQTLTQLGYALHARTHGLVVQVVGGTVRMTTNGTNPTASLGLLLSDGMIIELSRPEADLAKFITASGTPKLEIAAYVE